MTITEAIRSYDKMKKRQPPAYKVKKTEENPKENLKVVKERNIQARVEAYRDSDCQNQKRTRSLKNLN